MAYWNEGYRYRWKYMKAVIEYLKSMNAQITLEMGCMYIPLNDQSHQIELEQKQIVTGFGCVHDLNKPRYPYINKYFDCAVALQVWEHLDNHRAAFNELCRISKNVILSLPYKWTHGDKRHNNIDDDKILSWTGRQWDNEKIVIQRKICVWRDV
jgi:hypothetical protein